MKILAAAAFLLAAGAAHGYCIHNQLGDRSVLVEQEPHPEKLREDRTLRVTLKPGERKCCRNLDCNPGGRDESITQLAVTILGEPAYYCASEGDEYVKVTGDGLLRIMPNPRKSSLPYIVRVRTPSKDLTGPRGLPCKESLRTPKGKP